MEAENLLNVLRREKKILNELKSIATEKQVALVSNNREKLDKSIKDEERILPLIQRIEKERLAAIDEFYTENRQVRNDYHLETLLEKFSSILANNVVDEIKSIHLEIKSLVEDLTKLNKQNMYLINHSRQFLKETMATIISSSEKSILDKKV